MGKQYRKLLETDINFIKNQKMFFIASCSNKEVNLSPRGYDSLRVIDSKTIYMIDYLGSGNRTARDIEKDGEITLMFNSFDGKPKILRCFCKGETILNTDTKFSDKISLFNEDKNAIRQIFKFKIYAVETSCGMGVPIMNFQEERSEVRDYALKMFKQDKFERYVQDHRNPINLKEL